jgi:hypothetical protein
VLAQEAYWCQRSRLKWAFLGDKNNKFFHATTVARRRKNAIKVIQTEDRGWVTDEVQIRKLFVLHYKSVYNEPYELIQPSIIFPAIFLQSLPKLSHDLAFVLQQPPDVQEITLAVFALGPDKAFGPDGLNARLVQTY